MPLGRTKAAGKWTHNKKLDAEKARRIRERHAAGESREALAKEYGISINSCGEVLNYRTWAFAGPGRIEPPEKF